MTSNPTSRTMRRGLRLAALVAAMALAAAACGSDDTSQNDTNAADATAPTQVPVLAEQSEPSESEPNESESTGSTSTTEVRASGLTVTVHEVGELTVHSLTAPEFKAGLIEAFPDLGLEGAIDFAVPFLFPDGGSSS